MLRQLLRLFSFRRQEPTVIAKEPDSVVLYAAVENAPQNKSRRSNARSALSPTILPSARPLPHHRERLLSMQLAHAKLCGTRRCQRLKGMGISTTGDLATADLANLATQFGAPKKALKVLKQYRRAIRFSASVPGMMPRDALLLISIHRRSVRGLAMESPARLHRDLERFAESTQGRQQLRGRRIPSTRRLKKWISECETAANRARFHAMVA
ncbi:MAG: DUF4332 domain-containing protein [Rubripirellula sp.]|nr:DUF4332 domain-containing protein [Rubripirellula sp.]